MAGFLIKHQTGQNRSSFRCCSLKRCCGLWSILMGSRILQYKSSLFVGNGLYLSVLLYKVFLFVLHCCHAFSYPLSLISWAICSNICLFRWGLFNWFWTLSLPYILIRNVASSVLQLPLILHLNDKFNE